MQPEMELISTRDETGKNMNVRTEVYALDEFYSASPLAGRSDLKARRKIGALNDTQDMQGTLGKLATGAGAYYVQVVAGRDVIDSEVFQIQPKGQRLEIESSRGQSAMDVPPSAQAAATPAPVAVQSSAQSINDTTETIRATKELLREVQPPTQAAPALSAADIQKMIADGIREGLAQQKAAPATSATPSDPFEMVERVVDLQRKLSPPAQATTTPADPTENFLNQFEKFTEISERINPNGEGRGKWGVVTDVLKDVVSIGKDVVPFVMPMIMPARVQAMAQAADRTEAAPPAEAQPQATPAQPQAAQSQASNEPQNENEAMALIAYVAVSDLIKNKRAGRTADLIEEMTARFPSLRPGLDKMCAAQPEDVLTMLGQFVGRNDLHAFRHARDWVLDLQDDLTPDDGGEDDPAEAQQPDAPPSIVEMASTQAQ